LTYDARCLDTYGRLLAHVWVDGTDVGLEEVAGGLGCALVIPPNEDGREAFEAAEQVARVRGRGLWGACRRPWPCGR
jgi:micrococcal nuclease